MDISDSRSKCSQKLDAEIEFLFSKSLVEGAEKTVDCKSKFTLFSVFHQRTISVVKISQSLGIVAFHSQKHAVLIANGNDKRIICK